MSRKPPDLEATIRDTRKQLNDQLSCFEFRTEGKLSLLGEMRDFYRKRGDIEIEYAKSLERLCERFEKSTKQRNIKNEVRSTFNLWSTLLAETRRMARDRASLAESLGSEMVARIEIMAKDVTFLSRKCKDLCSEIQDIYFKDMKELNEQTKVYQYACHHSAEAHSKLMKSKEKVDAVKNSAVRKKKAEEKEKERLRQFNEQKHRQLKARNEYLLKLQAANARASQYFGNDLMDLVELMDHDYHEAFSRLAIAYHEAEQEACQHVLKATSSVVDQTQALNFENDLHYFLSEFSQLFTQPSEFSYTPFGDDDVSEYKVNTKDVFVKAQEMVKNLTEEVQTLKLQKEGDIRTIEHVNKNNLRKYRVQTVDDAIAVLEEMGDAIPAESIGKSVSLDRGSINPNTRAVQVLHASQKGKEDTLTFTMGAIHRKLVRGSQQRVLEMMLEMVEKSLSEQKVPPISIGGDYRIPKLFGGDCLEYIMATGCTIPLIIQSCCSAIEKEGAKTEGLFRVPGPAQQIEDLKKGFEEGRDPLMYSALKGIEITAVASVLKLYFRELSSPLFPCEKYYDFINCTRREDPQDRLDSLKDTINSLHPAIVTVMRYLFRFLYRLSLLASETKMNSANLALVFGPTLTRAPDDADPRMLHNDVPAINVLIQVCIERHEFLFGPDSEEDGLESPPPPPEAPKELDVVLSPPAVKSSTEGESQGAERIQTPDSFTRTPPPPVHPEEPTLLDQYQYPPDDENEANKEETQEPHPEEEPAVSPESVQPPEIPPRLDQYRAEVPVPREIAKVETIQLEEQPPLQAQEEEFKEMEEPHPPIKQEAEEIPVQMSKEGSANEGGVIAPPPRGVDTKISNKSLNTYFEQALVDIDATLDSMKKPIVEEKEGETMEEEKQQPSSVQESKEDELPSATTEKGLEEEEGDSDSDSEETMTITAKALYDYNARNEKELTFTKGSVLEVIEKTADGNWWDGFYGGKRGYVPVSYVEIAELQSVPEPPIRRDSVPKPEETGSTYRKSLTELPEEHVESPPSTPGAVEVTPEVKTVASIKKEPKAEQAETEKKKSQPPPIKSGTVSKLTQQFQSPTHQTTPSPPATSSQPPRVLFNPHRRNPSTDLTSKGSEGGGSHVPRSSSDSSKAKPPLPPPIRPKPEKEPPAIGASPFPLMSHDASVSVSPLQWAHLEQQVGGTKKPPVTGKKGSFQRSSAKGKKPDKPPLPSKPTAPPKGGSSELQAELAAVALRRRKQDGDTS